MSNYIEQGKSLLEKKEYIKAIEYFQAAIECMESPKDAHLGLAEALFASGRLKQGKDALYKAMSLDPDNPHGLSLIQKYCLPEATITPNNICPPSVDQDPVVSIKPHTVFGPNHYMVELKSGNKLFFRVGTKGCTSVCPEEDDMTKYWGDYDEPEGNLIIPSSINVKGRSIDVIGIDEDVFSLNEKLTSVFLPGGIQRIEHSAFSDTHITEINLPLSLKYIGDHAFSSTLLEEIQIPSSVKTIGDYCFSCCERLSEVYLGDGIIQIGDYAFDKCPIREIDIPESVKSIGDDAFPEKTIIRLHGEPPKINWCLDEDRYIVYVPQRKKYLYEEDEDWMYIKVNTY